MTPQTTIAVASLLGGAGMWLMLPRGGRPGHAIGCGARAGGAAGLFGSLGWQLAHWGSEGIFWTLAMVTILSAAAAVTFRSPGFCAIWFALSLLGTAGLFMVQGAQFLAVATIVVYAGRSW